MGEILRADFERKPMSKSLRFEVMKRDGFVCRYCGATANMGPLEVDHVVPVSKGGTNDPDNLVTACKDCNAGKYNREMGDFRFEPTSTESVLEHAEQMEAYADAVRRRQNAKKELANMLINKWCDEVTPGEGSYLRTVGRQIETYLSRYPFDWIEEAIGVTAAKRMKYNTDWQKTDQLKYFCGVMRKMAEDKRESAPRKIPGGFRGVY